MASSLSVGGVHVDLGMNSAKFDSGLKKAGAELDSFGNKSKSAAAAVSSSMGRAGGAMVGFGRSMTAGFVAPLAGLVTLTAAINGTRAALEKMGSIADQSAAAGISSDYFQTIAYQAQMAGVGVETVAGALASFAKSAGLAAEGKGRMVSTLQALNPELLRNIQLATSQEERIRLVADAIGNAKDAASAAAIASATLGDAGVKLVAAFQGGGAQLDAMVVKARDMGLIFDSQLVASADELGDKLDTANQIIDVKMKSALISLAPLMSDTAGWAAELARLMGIAYEQFKAIEDRQFLRPMQNELASTYNAMQPVKDRIAEIEAALAGGAPNGMVLKLDLTEAQGKLADLETQAMALLTRITELQGAPRSGRAPPSVTPETPRNPALTGGADLALLDLNLDPAKVETVAAGFRGVRAAAEESAIAIASNGGAVDVLISQFETAEGLAASFSSTIIDGALAGQDAVETLGDAFGQLGKQLIQMAADQAIKSLFANLLGAAGGTIAGGAALPVGGFIPGLTGPRLFKSGGFTGGAGVNDVAGLVHGREFVVNARSTAKHRGLLEALNSDIGYKSQGYAAPSGGLAPRMPMLPSIPQGGGAVNISFSPTIHAPGADAAGLARVVEEMQRMKADLPTTVRLAMRDVRKYGQR